MKRPRWCTARITPRISSFGMLFSMYAAAPDRMARWISPSESDVVSMITRASGYSFLISIRADVPSIPGKRRSINVRSGRCWRNIAIASFPFVACETKSMSVCEAMIVLRPSRNTGWSSTLKIRIGFGRSKGRGPPAVGPSKRGPLQRRETESRSYPINSIRCAADCPPEEKYSPSSVEYSGARFQPKP